MKVIKLNEAWGNAPAWLKKELNQIKQDSSDLKGYSAYNNNRVYTVPKNAQYGFKMGKSAIGVGAASNQLLAPRTTNAFSTALEHDSNLNYWGIDFKDAMYEFSQGKFYSEPVPTSVKSPLLKDPNLITVFKLANDQVYIRHNAMVKDGLINGNLSLNLGYESQLKFKNAGLEKQWDALMDKVGSAKNLALKFISVALLLEITTEFGYYKIDELPNAYDKLKNRANKYKNIGAAYNSDEYATDYSRSKLKSKNFATNDDGSISADTDLYTDSDIENRSTGIYGYRHSNGNLKNIRSWSSSNYKIDKSGYNISLAHQKLIDRLNRFKAGKWNANMQDILDTLASAEDFIKNLDYRHSDRYLVQETVALAAMVNQAYNELDRAIDNIESATIKPLPYEKDAIIADGFSKIKPLVKNVKDAYNEIIDRLYERKKYVPLTLD